MHAKHMARTTALAVGVGLAALTAGAGVATAQPGPPPCGLQGGSCQGPEGPGGQAGRGGPGQSYGGGPGGPQLGGPDGHGGPDGRQWGPPPRDLAWRGIDQGRYDHEPFNYNGSWVQPAFNADLDTWGFWFLGIWIPL